MTHLHSSSSVCEAVYGGWIAHRETQQVGETQTFERSIQPKLGSLKKQSPWQKWGLTTFVSVHRDSPCRSTGTLRQPRFLWQGRHIEL